MSADKTTIIEWKKLYKRTRQYFDNNMPCFFVEATSADLVWIESEMNSSQYDDTDQLKQVVETLKTNTNALIKNIPRTKDDPEEAKRKTEARAAVMNEEEFIGLFEELHEFIEVTAQNS